MIEAAFGQIAKAIYDGVEGKSSAIGGPKGNDAIDQACDAITGSGEAVMGGIGQLAKMLPIAL